MIALGAPRGLRGMGAGVSLSLSLRVASVSLCLAERKGHALPCRGEHPAPRSPASPRGWKSLTALLGGRRH